MTRRLALITLILLALVLAGGCGGGFDFADFETEYPEISFVLRIQDPDGNAIGNARLWVDGDRDDWLSEAFYWTIGVGFPQAWAGFQANWIREDYQIYQRIGDGGLRFGVTATKSGWSDASTVIDIPDLTAQQYFARDTLTMYPVGDEPPVNPPARFAEVVEAPVQTLGE